MVRVGIPVMEKNGYASMMGQHFGRVPYFAVVDTETSTITFIENTSTHTGGKGLPPEILQRNIDVMVCSALGRKAVRLFEELGIRVYIGATGTVKYALDRFASNQLQEATDETACREHRFHGQH
jgi:predicted Fe-Mo cluster-binding NifX family protein